MCKMRGIYHVIVQNRYLKYEFNIKRNITIVLIKETKDTHMAYNKHNLNPVYLHEKNKKTIEAKLPDIFKRLHQLR